jgi:hypothetical protein
MNPYPRGLDPPGKSEERRCPHCGFLLPEQRPAVEVEDLRRFCRDRNLVIFAGERVTEETAAAILGRQSSTLRNWRCEGAPLRFSRSGQGRGRIYYYLADLAQFLTRDENLCG